MHDFEGRVVVLAGAATGIGAASAQRLALEGARMAPAPPAAVVLRITGTGCDFFPA
jgi:NAD(P)-dependent dehydrogenase (short-subunit alcohol dehydrogenase family)